MDFLQSYPFVFPSAFIVTAAYFLIISILPNSEVAKYLLSYPKSGVNFFYICFLIILITSFIISAIGELLFEVEASREKIIKNNKAYLLAKRKYPHLSNELEDSSLFISLSVPLLINNYPEVTNWIVFHYATYQMLRDLFVTLWLIINVVFYIVIMKLGQSLNYFFIQMLVSIIIMGAFSFLYSTYYIYFFSSNRINNHTSNDNQKNKKFIIIRGVFILFIFLGTFLVCFNHNSFVFCQISINLIGCGIGYAILWKAFSIGIYIYSMTIESVLSVKFHKELIKENIIIQ